jgi:hypothetical protein
LASFDEEELPAFASNTPHRDVPWDWPIVDDLLLPGAFVRIQVQLDGSDFVPEE